MQSSPKHRRPLRSMHHAHRTTLGHWHPQQLSSLSPSFTLALPLSEQRLSTAHMASPTRRRRPGVTASSSPRQRLLPRVTKTTPPTNLTRRLRGCASARRRSLHRRRRRRRPRTADMRLDHPRARVRDSSKLCGREPDAVADNRHSAAARCAKDRAACKPGSAHVRVGQARPRAPLRPTGSTRTGARGASS